MMIVDLYIMEHLLSSYVIVNILLTQDYFFTIVEKDCNVQHEYTHQMDIFLCNLDKCDVCKENTYSTNEKNGPLIDLRKLKRLSTKINENQKDGKFHIINRNLNLLG